MMKFCFGIDIGGTTIKAGLFTEEGTLTEKWEIPTRTADGGVRILPDIAEFLLTQMRQRQIKKR